MTSFIQQRKKVQKLNQQRKKVQKLNQQRQKVQKLNQQREIHFIPPSLPPAIHLSIHSFIHPSFPAPLHILSILPSIHPLHPSPPSIYPSIHAIGISFLLVLLTHTSCLTDLTVFSFLVSFLSPVLLVLLSCLTCMSGWFH